MEIIKSEFKDYFKNNEKPIIEFNDRPKIEFTNELACAYAEGTGEGEDCTAEEQIEAFSYIAKNKLCRQSGEWYRRTLLTFVEIGVMDINGNINKK